MKYILLIVLFIIKFDYVHSQSIAVCPLNSTTVNADTESLMRNLQIPNCLDSLSNSREENDLNQLCDTCKPQLNTALRVFSRTEQAAPQLNVQNILLEELKKSVISNILNVSTLRNLPELQTDFSRSQASCNLDTLERDLNALPNCMGRINLNGLRSDLSNELANLVADDYSANRPGIFKRQAETCNYSDKAILNAKANLLESMLDDNTVTLFSQINATSADDLYNKISENPSLEPLFTLLQGNPILANFLKDPSKFKTFFSSIPRPTNQSVIRNSIYNSSNGAEIDNAISKKCNDSFKAFKTAACSPDALIGKASIPTLPSHRSPIIDIPVIRSGEFITLPEDEFQIQTNLDFLRICNIRSNTARLDLSSSLNNISDWMPEEYQDITFEKFRVQKYTDDIANTRGMLCDAPTPCLDGSIDCKLKNIFTANQATSTPEGRLANSSSSSVNALLRTMIGNGSGASPEARRILVQQGILPQADGTIVAQPQIAERAPNYIADQAARSVGASPQSQRTANAPVAQAKTRIASSAANIMGHADIPNNETQISAANSDNDNVEDEIIRRLKDARAAQLAGPTAAPQAPVAPSRNQARTQAPTSQNENIAPNQAPAQAAPVIAGAAPAFGNSASNNNFTDPNAPSRVAAQRAAASAARMNAALGNMSPEARAANGGLNADGTPADRRPASTATAPIEVRASMDNLLIDLNRMLQTRDWADNVRSRARAQQPIDMIINGTLTHSTFNVATNRYVSDNSLPAAAKSQLEEFINGLIERRSTAGGLQQALAAPRVR